MPGFEVTLLYGAADIPLTITQQGPITGLSRCTDIRASRTSLAYSLPFPASQTRHVRHTCSLALPSEPYPTSESFGKAAAVHRYLLKCAHPELLASIWRSNAAVALIFQQIRVRRLQIISKDPFSWNPELTISTRVAIFLTRFLERLLINITPCVAGSISTTQTSISAYVR